MKFLFAAVLFGASVFVLTLLFGFRFSHRRPISRTDDSEKVARRVQDLREHRVEERFEESAIDTLEGEGGTFVAHTK